MAQNITMTLKSRPLNLPVGVVDIERIQQISPLAGQHFSPVAKVVLQGEGEGDASGDPLRFLGYMNVQLVPNFWFIATSVILFSDADFTDMAFEAYCSDWLDTYELQTYGGEWIHLYNSDYRQYGYLGYGRNELAHIGFPVNLGRVSTSTSEGRISVTCHNANTKLYKCQVKGLVFASEPMLPFKDLPLV